MNYNENDSVFNRRLLDVICHLVGARAIFG